MRFEPAPGARLRVRLLSAGMAALLCAACGPGGPKRETDDGNGNGGGAPAAGITVLAGDAANAGSTDAKGTAARFSTPRGLALDANGNLYVADQANFVIRKIAADGTVKTFAGAPGISGTDDGKGNRARFAQPSAITIDASGNLFVTDGARLRKITPDGDVSTVATLSFGAFGVDAQNLPAGIAVDGAGNLFVTTGIDTRRIPVSNPGRAVTLETGAVAPVFGTGELVPRGVAVNADGMVYVADLTRTIGRAASGATALTTFVGTRNQAGKADGNATQASFQQVVALTVDQDGNLYAADAINNTIRKITPKGVVTTAAGTAGATTLKTGKLPGSFANLRGIATDGKGTLYATAGNAVVKIVLP